MSRAGSSARAKARQLTVEHIRKSSKLTLVLAAGGGSLGLVGGSGAAVAGAVVGAAGGAIPGLRGVRAAGARWRQGAAGERRTSNAVRSLRRAGWRLHDDLSIPKSRANLDHAWVMPSGRGIVVGDTKAWHAENALVRMQGSRLFYGPWCQDSSVQTIAWETSRVADLMNVPAVSILVLDGATVDRRRHPEGWIQITRSFYVVEQNNLVNTLKAVQDGPPNSMQSRRLSKALVNQFPPYRRVS